MAAAVHSSVGDGGDGSSGDTTENAKVAPSLTFAPPLRMYDLQFFSSREGVIPTGGKSPQSGAVATGETVEFRYRQCKSGWERKRKAPTVSLSSLIGPFLLLDSST